MVRRQAALLFGELSNAGYYLGPMVRVNKMSPMGAKKPPILIEYLVR